MSTNTIITFDLKKNNFLDRIIAEYTEFNDQGASDIELKVTEDEEGYEVTISGKINGAWTSKTCCPKPCDNPRIY